MAFAPSKPAPMLSSAIGVAQLPSMDRPLSSIGGKSIARSENGRPAKIPSMIGLVMMPRSVLPTRPRWSACCASGAVTVSTSTEKMLYSGTLATIISGTRPALPYRFCTKASPSIACEPRKAPCVNAPTILLSLRKRDAPIQTAKKYTVVAPAQKKKNTGSNCSVMRPCAISRNSRIGSSTLNDRRSRSVSVCLVKKFLLRSQWPSTMIAKIGTVAFRQNIRLSIGFSLHGCFLVAEEVLQFL